MTTPSLRDQRNAKGIKQSWLASKLKVSKSYLCMMENGKRAWPDKVLAEYKALLGITEK